MLPRADIAGTRPVASIEAARPISLTGDAHQELAQRLNRIALGTSFKAEVLSRLTDGAFLVRVADTTVRMNLPGGAQVGQTLDLTLAATQPRVTFLLASGTNDNSATLSSTGRLVDWILHSAQQAGAPTALAGKAPLASAPSTPPAQLAGAMKDALASSGLFYESHVEQWANGERSLASLLREPQALKGDLPQLAAALRAATKAEEAAPGSKPNQPGAPHAEIARLISLISKAHGGTEAGNSLIRLLQAAVQAGGAAAPPAQASDPDGPAAPTVSGAPISATAGPPENGLPRADMPGQQLIGAENAVHAEPLGEESVRTINLQLNTLEQQRVIWQGELWPGQTIEWEVGEDTSGGQHADTEEKAWQSVIRFELPVLGKVSAAIHLAGGRVRVQVRADSETAAAVLRAQGAALGSAMEAAGLPLDQLIVQLDEVA